MRGNEIIVFHLGHFDDVMFLREESFLLSNGKGVLLKRQRLSVRLCGVWGRNHAI